jgi:hypothetical protein
MIGGIIMVLVAIWVYQTVLKTNKSHGLFWVAGCAALFFAVQWLLVQLNIVIIDTYQGDDVGSGYDRALTSIGDRSTNAEGSGGTFLNILYEIMPPLGGFFAVAFVRVIFITKESITVGNLFGGIKEMFLSIRDSFKTSE